LRRAADPSRGIDAEILASTSWRSAEPELVPPVLTFVVPQGVKTLELVIEEGDNAPLPLTSSRLAVPSTALRFYHPGSPLTLVYGNRAIQAPRYDLSLLASRFLAEPARDVGFAASAPRPDAKPEKEQKLFWMAIAIAAGVLLFLLARLMPSRASGA
ncbi:MAG TPA: hypothetical protein VFL80_05375, partial [Thermoanaerobaculia bacterium]|nr:hypothetical protein [Thermoanaerobaculia bacterium]